MDLIAYWNVVKRQRRIVVIGLCVAAGLAFISVVKPTATGLGWRTPPVYDAKTTLLVTKAGFQVGRVGDPAIDKTFSERMEGLASLYTQLAESDPIERAVKRQLDLAVVKYGAAPIAGVDQRPLPLIQIRAFATSPAEAVAVANSVSHALRAYLVRQQANNGVPKENRIELPVWERAHKAEVFAGVRLTKPIMLFLLVSILTAGVAFVVDNSRGGRRSAQARVAGESEATLGIVRDEPERHLAEEGSPRVPEVPARIQPASPGPEEAVSEASPARGRWARPS